MAVLWLPVRIETANRGTGTLYNQVLVTSVCHGVHTDLEGVIHSTPCICIYTDFG